MCIRDRASAAGAKRARRIRTEVVIANRRRIEVPSNGLGGCLLYTSDAADERSSVDLGGRRIIKKKHN